jgi:hypothetical protein
VFPAEVLLSDGSLLIGVRAFVTTERLIVWREFEGQSPGIVLEMRLAEPGSIQPSHDQSERVEIAGLTSWAILNRGRGCGCGSKLKALGSPVPW